MLFNRLVKRQKHLKKWAKRIKTNTYRLYDRDIPEIPLVLDIYGNAVSGALYKRPYEKDQTEETFWLEAMNKVIAEALDISTDRIFIKIRQKQRGNAQYNRLGKDGFWTDAAEGDLLFRVNLSDYLDTGLFPDARRKRAFLLTEAGGKKMLNLFSYTCTLSVCAAAGAAAETDSVDMSNTYLEWGAVNFKLNGFDSVTMDEMDFMRARKLEKPHRLIRADVLGFLNKAAASHKKWDLVILDPPVFSNSKKMTTHLDLRRDYAKLIKQCFMVLNPGGSVWFSSNAGGFNFDSGQFPGAAIRQPDFRDEDFRNKKIPSCWIINP